MPGPMHLLLAALIQEDWLPIDPRSKGMGNSGVASAEGASAGYWNPSRLAHGSEEFSLLGGGFGFQGYLYMDTAIEGDLLSSLDTLADLYQGTNFAGIQGRFNAGTASEQDLQDAFRVVQSILELTDGDDGVVGALGGGLDLRLGYFGLSVRQHAQAGISPFLDFSIPNASALTSGPLSDFFDDFTVTGPLTPAAQDLAQRFLDAGLTGDSDGDGTPDADELAFHAQQALGDAAISDPRLTSILGQIAAATGAIAGTGSDSLTLAFNGSGVEIRGFTMREVGVSFGVPILPVLSAGITLREVIAETFRARVSISDIEDGEAVLEELLRNFDENTTRTNRFTFDLGACVTVLGLLNVGVTAKNLIPMKFEVEGGDDIEIDPQVRAGVSVAFGMLKLGVDLDVLENDLGDLVEGLKSRIMGGGAEFQIGGSALGLSVRGGLFDNIASSESSPVWTLGLGVRLAGFFLDANGQIAWSDVKIEEAVGGVERVPERISGSLALGFDLKF